jgi:hypothetical protein
MQKKGQIQINICLAASSQWQRGMSRLFRAERGIFLIPGNDVLVHFILQVGLMNQAPGAKSSPSGKIMPLQFS